MPTKPVLKVHLASKSLKKLDAVVAATRRTRSEIATEALEAWIEREFELIEDLRIGLEEVRAGKGIPHQEAMRKINAAIKRAAKRQRYRKAYES